MQVKAGELLVSEDLGVLDMASAGTIADFVERTVSDFPAEHYMIVMWDHGRGWVGFSSDQVHHCKASKVTQPWRERTAGRYLPWPRRKTAVAAVTL